MNKGVRDGRFVEDEARGRQSAKHGGAVAVVLAKEPHHAELIARHRRKMLKIR